MAQARIKVVSNKKFIGFQITGEEFARKQRIRSQHHRQLTREPAVPLPDLPSPSHPLYGPILKLHVANNEIEQLETEIKALANTKLNGAIFKDDPDPEYKLIRLVVNLPPDPVWSVRIGEIVHNLRSALDIAVTQLSIGCRGRPTRPEFPIFVFNKTTLEDRKNKVFSTRARISHLPAVYQTTIKAAQPYHAGSLSRRHPLWRLHRLNIDDKHNILTYATSAIAGSQYTFPALPARFLAGSEFFINVPFEHGAKLARVGREVQVIPKYTAVVRFDNGCPSVAGEEVMHTLRSIEEQVRKVMAEFVSVHS